MKKMKINWHVIAVVSMSLAHLIGVRAILTNLKENQPVKGESVKAEEIGNLNKNYLFLALSRG